MTATSMAGPVERAVCAGIAPGAYETAAGKATFWVASLDEDRVLLLLGAKRTRTGLTWTCLEGVARFLEGKGWVEVGSSRMTEGVPGTLDEYLETCLKRDTAAYVAAVLAAAGVLEVDPGPPVRIRLKGGFQPG